MKNNKVKKESIEKLCGFIGKEIIRTEPYIDEDGRLNCCFMWQSVELIDILPKGEMVIKGRNGKQTLSKSYTDTHWCVISTSKNAKNIFTGWKGKMIKRITPVKLPKEDIYLCGNSVELVIATPNYIIVKTEKGNMLYRGGKYYTDASEWELA